MNNHIRLKRVLLKLSGESLSRGQDFGVNLNACQQVARSLKEINQAGVEIGVVIGGGNILRGIDLSHNGMPRAPADYMGMVATLMNGIAIQQALDELGAKGRVLTALDCPKIAESYSWYKAIKYLREKEILIFVGGTGNPYFTTDTAAALRASEIGADALLKATKVNGIYDRDPLKYSEAIKYSTLSYNDYLDKKLQVMDATSIMLCQNSKIPVFVFNMNKLLEKDVLSCLCDFSHGTLVAQA